MREKLIELIGATHYGNNSLVGENFQEGFIAKIADNLIANGVTVQEGARLYWKPVKPGEWNLTCSACDSHLGCRENANFCPECGAKFVYPKAVMPQPPKEDEQ